MRIFCDVRFFCLLCSVALIAGCGSGPDVAGHVGKKNESNLQKVANSMFLYRVRIGKACKNEKELCDFVQNDSTIEKNLTLMQIERSSFPDHLISERDGEPFFIRYGAAVPTFGPGVPLVFESIGVDGERKIGWSDAKVTSVSDKKEYEKLKAGKFKREKVMQGSDGAAEAASSKAEKTN